MFQRKTTKYPYKNSVKCTFTYYLFTYFSGGSGRKNNQFQVKVYLFKCHLLLLHRKGLRFALLSS